MKSRSEFHIVVKIKMEEQTIYFAKGCAERGLCPRCLNIGEQNDNDIDLFGVCRNCGYVNPHNAEAEGR